MYQKPNIVFIFSDQQRWDTLGVYGQELDITPNLDNMAKEGVLFENAFTCQPVCGPARSCLQTGKYSTETGCYRNNIALPINEKTLAHYLSEVGYEVGYIGKWHLASQDGEIDYRTSPIPIERRGGYKDYWLASDMLEYTSHGYGGHMFDSNMKKVIFNKYRVDALTDFAIDYIGTRDNKKPFYLFLSYIEPHHQNTNRRYEGPLGSKEKFKDFKVPGDLEGMDGDWKESYPDYLGCCNSIDYNVGRIREKIKERGMEDNTIIIYTSDHGSHFRTRNEEYKRSCHDSSIRIPLIIYGPGFKEGMKIDNLVSLIDLPSTILKCAGIEQPENMRGNPLQKLVNGYCDEWPKEVFIQISESQVGRAIRTKRWKYSIYAPDKDPIKDSSSDIYKEQFLYDLVKDPYERNNLVGDDEYIDVRNNLSMRLKKRMVEIGEKEPIIKGE